MVATNPIVLLHNAPTGCKTGGDFDEIKSMIVNEFVSWTSEVAVDATWCRRLQDEESSSWMRCHPLLSRDDGYQSVALSSVLATNSRDVHAIAENLSTCNQSNQQLWNSFAIVSCPLEVTILFQCGNCRHYTIFLPINSPAFRLPASLLTTSAQGCLLHPPSLNASAVSAAITPNLKALKNTNKRVGRGAP
jgi:hypothetical protein